MVDIHSHILYGIDDGARTIDDSIAMLQIAADSGTTDIVATPHSDLKFRYQPPTILRQIEELQAAMGDKIRIHRGCDFHLHFDNIRECIADPGKFTINGKRYLMVEFSDQAIPKTIDYVFEEMLGVGITPVITHPERNKLLMQRMKELAGWIRMGGLVQVTGQSFLGRFGKSAQAAAAELVNHKMVHFVASDAHDTQHRPPDLRDAYEHVASEWGQSLAHNLFEKNPAATLFGNDIEYEEPEGKNEKRPLWKFW